MAVRATGTIPLPPVSSAPCSIPIRTIRPLRDTILLLMGDRGYRLMHILHPTLTDPMHPVHILPTPMIGTLRRTGSPRITARTRSAANGKA